MRVHDSPKENSNLAGNQIWQSGYLFNLANLARNPIWQSGCLFNLANLAGNSIWPKWLFTQPGQSGEKSNLANLAIHPIWLIWREPPSTSNLAIWRQNQSGNLAIYPIWQMLEKDKPKHLAAGGLASVSFNPSFRMKSFALGL